MLKKIFLIVIVAFIVQFNIYADSVKSGSLKLFPKSFKITKNDLYGKSFLNRSKSSITGIEVGFNLKKLQKAVASVPPFWIKNSKWNQIRLKNFYIDYKEGARTGRLIFGATLRYETFTKDFVHFWGKGRRWRTASVTSKMRGSVAVKLNPITGTLEFYDFKAESIRVKNIPPWLENYVVRKFVNTTIKKSFNLNLKVGGLNANDIQLRGITRKGDFLLFSLNFKKAVNISNAINLFKGITIPNGIAYSPSLKMIKQRYINTKGDLKLRHNRNIKSFGERNYGIEIEFEKNRLAKELYIEYSYDGRKWIPNNYPQLNKRDFRQFILGDYQYRSMWGTRRSIRPNRTIYIRAKYKFINGKFSKNYFQTSVETDNYALSRPQIQKVEFVNTKKYGTVLKINLKRQRNSTPFTLDTNIFFDGRKFGSRASYLKRKTFLDRYDELPGRNTDPSYSISPDGDEITIYPGSVLGKISGYRTEEFNGTLLKGNWPIYSFSKMADLSISYKLTFPSRNPRQRERLFAAGPIIRLKPNAKLLHPITINTPSLKKAKNINDTVSLEFYREKNGAMIEVEVRKIGEKKFKGKWPTDHWTDDIRKSRRHKKNRYTFYFKNGVDIFKGRVHRNISTIHIPHINKNYYVRARYIVDNIVRGNWSRPVKIISKEKNTAAPVKFNLYKKAPHGFSVVSGNAINNGDGTGRYTTISKKVITDLSKGQSLKVEVLGGKFKYISIYAIQGRRRYMLTKTPSQSISTALFKRYIRSPGIRSFAIYLNGDERSYIKERSALRIIVPKRVAVKSGSHEKILSKRDAINNGRGSTQPGLIMMSDLIKIKSNSKVSVKTISGRLSYVTIYVVMKNGQYSRVYRQSGNRPFNINYLKRYERNRKNINYFKFYVNGDNKRKINLACTIKLVVKN